MVTNSVRLSLISAGIAVLSFACQMLTARTFGASHAFDVYLFAVSIPFLVMGAGTGALSQAFVPRLIAARSNSTAYMESISVLLTYTLGGAVLIALGGFAVTVWQSSALATIFTPSDRAAIKDIARVAWLSADLALVASALTAVHHSEKSFILPAITNSTLYLGVIGSIFLIPVSRGPVLLAWGMLAGSLAAVLVLLPTAVGRLPVRRLGTIRTGSLFDGTSRVILVVLANCAFTGLAPVEALLAPKFGPGALSYLGYSQRLIIAIGTLVVAGPNVLLVPAIAEASAVKDADRVAVLASKTITAVLGIASLAALFFYFLRVPLIRLLLERGAFDAATTRGVAATLPWLLLGSVAMVGAQPTFRALYGQNRHLPPALAGLAIPTLYFALAGPLSTHWGLQGICVAYASSWWLVLLVLLNRILGHHKCNIVGMIMQRTAPWVAVIAVTGAALWIGHALFLNQDSNLSTSALVLRTAAVAALGAVSLSIMTPMVWPMPEIRGFLRNTYSGLFPMRRANPQ